MLALTIRRSSPLVFALALLSLSGGCGSATVGILANSGGSGGGTTPTITAFDVPNPKTSPATLHVEASAGVTAELFYARAGGAETPMSALSGPGVAGNQVALASGPNDLTWDFATELGSPDFEPSVDLIVRHPGGAPISGGSLHLGMGNDPPVVLLVDPMPTDPADPLESSGNVEVRLGVSDSSSDVVAILVEWRRASDAPDVWQPATAAGVFPGGVETDPSGVTLSFFWNTNVDLADGDLDVLLRATADDGTLDASSNPIGVSEPRLSGLLHIDNNEEPIVQLFNDVVIANPDERRGIPVPFRVFDEEGDRVETIFQWRREGEEFPSLLEAEIDAVLADPVLRRERHICTEYPRFAHGLVVPIDATTVRLPELARGESWILASGLEGRTLELLRPSSTPEAITPTWASNPLVSPIAALPVGDGLSALVLDAPGNGRVREIELATGAVVREIATLGAGVPSAMALERGEQAVLVATDLSGVWRIERVELASGAITELIVSAGSQPGPVRGLASLGTNAAVFTAGSALFFLDYRDPLVSQLGTMLSDLATPWGVVVDPLPPNRLYLAEREAVTASGTGRILAVDLDSHGKLPVVVRTEDLQPANLERPSALALERNGSRMLIVTNAPGGTSQLVGLDLGARGKNVSFPIGPPRASEIASIATGADELRSAALPGASELLIGGGLEQRRAIVAYASAGQAATLDAALQPEARPGTRWRISAELRPELASPTGLEATFLWSSAEDMGGGQAVLRALARDDEFGVATEGRASKRVRGALDVEPLVLGGFPTTFHPTSVAAADLDGDGDQDLVSANGNLTVFFQSSPGSFNPTPLVLGPSGATSVTAADLDGDGDQDLVSANFTANNLTVFFQSSPGTFASAPLVLGGPGTTNSPFSVAAADLDGDGDQDLVSANADNGFNLTVFFQSSPGSFDPTPLVLSDSRGLSVATADLDGDGDQDLVSANGNLTVFFQTSSGSFDPTPLVLSGGLLPNLRSVAAADLDGDGDQDLASTDDVFSILKVFFQSTPGSFDPTPLVLGGPGITNSPFSVAAADLDGDGDQDLVSANSNNLTVFFQSSPGTFGSGPLVLGNSVTTNRASSVAAADLDGDGDQDLVSANVDGNNLTTFFQDSPGSFATAPLVLGAGITSIPFSVAAADLDSDGDLDLVSANEGSNLTVFFQSLPGSFDPTPLVLGAGILLTPFSVVAADLDGDGDQDLVSANVDGNNLAVFFQNSPGSFASAPLVIGGFDTFFPFFVAAADLDGDGDQDLISDNSGGLTVFFQSPPGGFDPTPLVLGGPITPSSLSAAAADLDGDGDQDIVSTGASALTVFFQSSPGSFDPTPLVLGGFGASSPISVAAADLDGDGDQDLVSANTPNNLTVFFQSTPGNFDPPLLVLGGPAGPLCSSVAAADIDGDGDQDIVSAGDTLRVFFQNSPGSFDPGVFPTTESSCSVAVADIDGDGDQDLVSAGSNLKVFWGGR